MSIKLTQWLCPERHCIMALLYEEAEKEESAALEEGEAMFTDKGGSINRWCGICGSPKVEPETRNTKYQTMEEAYGPMRDLQRKNAIARDILGGRF